jgi:hypothetical protein
VICSIEGLVGNITAMKKTLNSLEEGIRDKLEIPVFVGQHSGDLPDSIPVNIRTPIPVIIRTK